MKLTDTIKGIQSALDLDPTGLGTLETWQAIHRKLVPPESRSGRKARGPASRAPEAGLVDERSERNIATLEASVRPHARALGLDYSWVPFPEARNGDDLIEKYGALGNADWGLHADIKAEGFLAFQSDGELPPSLASAQSVSAGFSISF